MTITYTYDEVLEASLEYFNKDELAAKVFVDKYALKDLDGNFYEKTPADMHRRLAKEFARIEAKYPNALSEEVIFNYLDRFKWIVPQGSPMSAIGNNFQIQTLGNCYVLEPPLDSYGGILKADQELAQLMKRRAGVGLSLDNLRPKGLPTKNAAKTTDGIGVFMERFSNTCREVAQCIAEGERVLTDSGLKAIEDVIPNEDKVWTKKGWVAVKDVLSNGKKNTIKTTTKNGFSITTTKDHIFLTEEGGDTKEVRIGELGIGGSVVLIPGSHNRDEQEVELVKNDYVKRGSNQSGRRHQNLTFPNALDKELAYFLGYFHGDGSVESDKFGEPRSFDLACGHDWPKIENKLVNIIFSKFNYESKVGLGDGAVNRVRVFSKEICSFIEDNGLLKKKAHEISVPTAIFNSPAYVQMAFLAGFFDADGYNSGKKKGYMFSTVCRSFAEDIQTLLMANGVISKIHVEDRSNKGWQDLNTVSVTGSHAQARLVELMGASVKVQSNKFVAKRDNYTTPFKAKTLGFKRSAQNSFIPDQSQFVSAATYLKAAPIFNVDDQLIITDKIVKMEDVGETNTYDLVLESEHLFWCEGFYVHNSGRRGAEMQMLSVHHPDIETFITIKKDLTKVTGSNISVKLTDEFMVAVRDGKDYEQRWPVDSDNPTVSRMVSAKQVWDMIIDAAWASAEPGLFFIDNQVKYTPADIYASVDKDWLSTCTNPSLRADTLVLTSEGAIPIKRLADNKKDIRVLNIDGEWQDAIVFCSGRDKQLYRIKFSNGQEVYCTPEHKWPLLNRRNDIRDLRTGKVRKKETKDLKSGEKIYLPSFDRPIDNQNCSLSNEDGFVLGWYYGDGWRSYHKVNESIQYGFIFSKEDLDSGIGDRVLNYTNALAKRPSTLRKDGDANAKTYCTTDNNVLDQFEKIGAGSKENGVPKSVWQGSHDFVLGFIDGLFSSGGHVRKSKLLHESYVNLTSSKEKLANDTRRLLAFYGIKSYIVQSTSKLNDKEYQRFDVRVVGMEAKKFARTFSLSNKNKQNSLNEILKMNSQTPGASRNSYAKERNYLTIKSVELTDIYEDVYDITVKDNTATFLTEVGVTGNCGEIGMGVDSCRLMIVNLFSFVVNPYTDDAYFDYGKLKEVSEVAQKLMDDVVDLELEKMDKIIAKIDSDPEREDVKKIEKDLWVRLRKNCEAGRRTGLGITGLGDALAAVGIRYGSEESIKTVEEMYKTLTVSAFKSSAKMARDRGAFPLYDVSLEKGHPYISRILNADLSLKRLHNKHGRRNIALTTTAPTGSVSILTQTTSGIEPAFLLEYDRFKKVNPNDEGVMVHRVDKMGDAWQKFKVYHHNYKTWMDISGKKKVEESPYYKATSADVDWLSGVNLQAAAQKWICHSISRTANIPNDASKELVSKIYMAAWESGCKGYTVYRDGCRDGVLVSSVAEENDKDGRPTNIVPSNSPKRPEELPADVLHATVKGVKWTILVGLLNGEPYEMFMGKADAFKIPSRVSQAKLVRVKSGNYNLLDQTNNVLVKDVIKTSDSGEAAWTTRMMSMALRHGVPINYLIDQLSKDGSVVDVNNVLARLLRKYNKKKEASTEKCPQCGSTELKYEDGCSQCLSCGFAGCN